MYLLNTSQLCLWVVLYPKREKMKDIISTCCLTIIDVVLKTTKQTIGNSVSHLLSQIHKTDYCSESFIQFSLFEIIQIIYIMMRDLAF